MDLDVFLSFVDVFFSWNSCDQSVRGKTDEPASHACVSMLANVEVCIFALMTEASADAVYVQTAVVDPLHDQQKLSSARGSVVRALLTTCLT